MYADVEKCMQGCDRKIWTPAGRPRCWWGDTLLWILEKWKDLDWVRLTQDRDRYKWWTLVTAMNLQVP
jgi:hypothetical protein